MFGYEGGRMVRMKEGKDVQIEKRNAPSLSAEWRDVVECHGASAHGREQLVITVGKKMVFDI